MACKTTDVAKACNVFIDFKERGSLRKELCVSNPKSFIPQFPLLVNSLGPVVLEEYRKRIRTDAVLKRLNYRGCMVLFRLTSIDPAEYVRAIQEIEMLSTKVNVGDKKTSKARHSFSDVWRENSVFRELIMSSENQEETKWKLEGEYGYRLATNFMPMYAKSIFEYFDAKNVLDPCAGWGDRMAGALSSRCVRRYVGFDPNKNLMNGYKHILRDFGSGVRDENKNMIEFDNGYVIYNMLFEDGDCLLSGSIFDFAFTSPPFFDFEDYGEYMPKYTDWIDEFYKPLFELTHKYLKIGGVFAVYVKDTISGRIEDFVVEKVPKFTSFVVRGRIGFIGGCSKRKRTIYVLKRTL